MPIGKKLYLHNNVTPSLFHYQHIRTAQGLQSKSIFDVDENKDSKKQRTFRQLWSNLSRTFTSAGEILLLSCIIALFGGGIFLLLQSKYFSEIKHSEL